jgi:hypothetical protein
LAAGQRGAKGNSDCQQTAAQQGVKRTRHTAAPEWKHFSIACVPNENQKVIGLDENNFDSVIQ